MTKSSDDSGDSSKMTCLNVIQKHSHTYGV